MQLLGGCDPVAETRKSLASSCSGATSKASGAPPASRAPVLAMALCHEVQEAIQDVSVGHDVFVPVLASMIPLKPGGVLKALRDALPPRRPPAPIMVSVVAKKAKLA